MIAVLACKLCRSLIRLLGRGGTDFPGRVALKLCPNLLGELAKNVTTVIVTGTNGKTTTSRMIEQSWQDAGISYFANKSGANLLSGVTAEFAVHSTLTGRCKYPYALIEADEAALKFISKYVDAKVIVFTNVFRDQLDRYGEVTHTRDLIASGIQKAPGAVLCLNADCSLTASLGWDVPNKTVYFGLENISSDAVPSVSDAPHCLRCGARYAYRRYTFAHLGDWYCPACGAQRPAPDMAVESVEALPGGGSAVTMKTPEGTVSFDLALPALYNVCNAAAALTAARAMGWDMDICCAALADFGAVFGRMEQLTVGETSVRIVLVKNPAGCDRALEFLASQSEDVLPIFCLNDNAADGTDVSWIWDADYESLLAARQYASIGVYGVRAQDMRLRLKYAGADDAAITVYDTADDLAAAVQKAGKPVVVLPNYTSMLTVRDKLSALAGGGRFWE